MKLSNLPSKIHGAKQSKDNAEAFKMLLKHITSDRGTYSNDFFLTRGGLCMVVGYLKLDAFKEDRLRKEIRQDVLLHNAEHFPGHTSGFFALHPRYELSARIDYLKRKAGLK